MESRRAADRDVSGLDAHFPAHRRVSPGASRSLCCAPPALPKQRVVNYYNWSDYQDPTVLDEFTKETGIAVRLRHVRFQRYAGGQAVGRPSGYDVVVPTAYFLARQINAGIFRKLDKSKLPNLRHAWPEIAKQLAVYDPGNHYAVNYMWGTTGIGYNVKKVKEIFGPDAVDRFLGLRFQSATRSRSSRIAAYTCSIHPTTSCRRGCTICISIRTPAIPAICKKSPNFLLKIRPYVRKFHSSEYLNALATGEICFVVGFSGDVKQAQKRAAEAKGGIEIGYSIPKEGAQLWFDNLAIPKDAPDPQEAHELINYLIRPEVAAKNTNYVSYANGDVPSQFIDKSILDDRTVYPDAETMAKLYTIIAHDQKTQRLINRLWTRIKTGE